VCLSLSLSQNELALLEFIHSLVETMDKYFESVCELDVSSTLEHNIVVE
jgi:AP-4 complex subunit sigma-1